MSTFWKHATTEQRLAQIDAGILLGLTAGQIGMNCGTSAGTIRGFAYYHGRKFGVGDGARRKLAMNGQKTGAVNIKTAAVTNTKRVYAYFGWDQSNAISARIFPSEVDGERLFDPHPCDEGVFT